MRNIANRTTEDIAVDTINLILGIGLAFTPWLFGYAGESTAAWNAWIVGGLVALVALGAFVRFAEWEEWVNLALGVWALLSPWLLGFSGTAEAMYAHVFGIAVSILAAVELWLVHNKPVSTV